MFRAEGRRFFRGPDPVLERFLEDLLPGYALGRMIVCMIGQAQRDWIDA